MADLLNMDKLNALPHPLWARSGGSWWPIHDIEVQTGLYRIDACGMLDVCHFGSLLRLRDADGIEHDPDTFYTDYDQHQGERSE